LTQRASGKNHKNLITPLVNGIQQTLDFATTSSSAENNNADNNAETINATNNHSEIVEKNNNITLPTPMMQFALKTDVMKAERFFELSVE